MTEYQVQRVKAMLEAKLDEQPMNFVVKLDRARERQERDSEPTARSLAQANVLASPRGIAQSLAQGRPGAIPWSSVGARKA
jgi:hypothetical protein